MFRHVSTTACSIASTDGLYHAVTPQMMRSS